jgi:hypothetical protein
MIYILFYFCEVEDYHKRVYGLIQTILWIHVVMTFYWIFAKLPSKTLCDNVLCPLFLVNTKSILPTIYGTFLSFKESP